RLYGVDRILDGDRRVAADVVRQTFVDYRVASRWYVEGPTEAGAVARALRDPWDYRVQVVNLKGEGRAEGGLGLCDDLKSDERAGIYSFVMIDADRPDFVQALREEARADAFCGEFYLSNPDFEFANLTVAELVEVTWGMLMKAIGDGFVCNTPLPELRASL